MYFWVNMFRLTIQAFTRKWIPLKSVRIHIHWVPVNAVAVTLSNVTLPMVVNSTELLGSNHYHYHRFGFFLWWKWWTQQLPFILLQQNIILRLPSIISGLPFSELAWKYATWQQLSSRKCGHLLPLFLAPGIYNFQGQHDVHCCLSDRRWIWQGNLFGLCGS